MRRDCTIVSARQGAVPGRALRRLVSWTVLVAAALSGCESPPPSVYVSGSQPTPVVAIVAVGNNQVGEPCHYQPASTGEFGIEAQRAAALYCGYWGQPSGRIFELGEADAARLYALATSGSWRSYIDDGASEALLFQLVCDPLSDAMLCIWSWWSIVSF